MVCLENVVLAAPGLQESLSQVMACQRSTLGVAAGLVRNVFQLYTAFVATKYYSGTYLPA